MTRIGLLSDPHGRAAITRRAVAALLAHGVDILLCLGDVGSTQVIDELVVNQPGTGEQIPARLVFGNTDMDSVALGRYAQGTRRIGGVRNLRIESAPGFLSVSASPCPP